MLENNDVVAPQTAESMRAAIERYPHLREVIETALAAGESSPQWEAAELAICQA